MSKGLLGVDISQKTIRYVYLQKIQQEYHLIQAGKIGFGLDLSKPASLSQAIMGIIEKEKLDVGRIFAAVSRSDVSIHQIILPKLKDDEIEEVIAAEIEKIPAFLNRDFDYIFKKYPHSEDKDKVVLAAIERQILDFIVQEITGIGIPFSHLEISPLNLIDIVPTLKNSGTPQAVLVLQNQFSYLSVMEQQQYKFFYRIPLGLDHLALAASEPAKEHLLESWSAELKRLWKSYLTEHKNNPAQQLWLVYDKDFFAGLNKLIAKDLNLDVHVLPLEKIQGLKVKNDTYLNPIYLLALTPVLSWARKIKNPFPLDHFFRSQRLKKYVLKVAAVCLVLMGVVATTFTVFQKFVDEQSRLASEEIDSDADEIKTHQAEAKGLYARYQEYMNIRQGLLDQATYVYSLNRVSWSHVLAVVAEELPQELSLSSFKFSESGEARIQGDAFRMESVAELMRKVDNSSILEKGKFDFLKEKNLSDQDQKIYHFGILAKLRDLRKTDDGPQKD